MSTHFHLPGHRSIAARLSAVLVLVALLSWSITAATPVVNANVRLIARNNEVLGTVKTDSRGYARFDAGLKRGEGGLAPAVLVAETPDGDYAFLDLSTAAFDLTDRGVKGRQEPGPIDGFAYTDRGVYRGGEAVHLSALTRDRTGKASGVPVSSLSSRRSGTKSSTRKAVWAIGLAFGSVCTLARQVPVMAEPASLSMVARPPWP